jgi:ABC-type amino acid transport substrate-binding protein
VVATIGIAAFLIVNFGFKEDSNDSHPGPSAPTVAPIQEHTRPTLDIVRERGFVRCGINLHSPGFCNRNAETGKLEGINVDQVRTAEALRLLPIEKN